MDTNETEQAQKAKTSKWRKAGLIILLIIGIPLLLFGTCILILTAGGY